MEGVWMVVVWWSTAVATLLAASELELICRIRTSGSSSGAADSDMAAGRWAEVGADAHVVEQGTQLHRSHCCGNRFKLGYYRRLSGVVVSTCDVVASSSSPPLRPRAQGTGAALPPPASCWLLATARTAARASEILRLGPD